MKIGSHVSLTAPDFFLGSVKEAISYGSNTFMFYTGAPQNSLRIPVARLNVPTALEYLKENNINIEDVIVHAPYLINLANLDPVKYSTSLNLLFVEVERTLQFGCKYIVLHPGSSLTFDKQDALKAIASGINKVVAKFPKICILLETMAGKGSEVGKTFEEINTIISYIDNKNNIGVCLDTCHINDGGYNLNNSKQIVEEFDKIIGLSYLKVIHLNDSKNELDSHKDRHANIGYGTLGFDNIINILYNPGLEDKIFILETPWVKYNDKEIYPPYKFEIEMLKKQAFNEHLNDDIYAYYHH